MIRRTDHFTRAWDAACEVARRIPGVQLRQGWYFADPYWAATADGRTVMWAVDTSRQGTVVPTIGVTVCEGDGTARWARTLDESVVAMAREDDLADRVEAHVRYWLNI